MTGCLARIRAVVLNDLRVLKRDPVFVLVFTLMPLAFMAFTKGAFAAGLNAEFPGSNFNGSEQVVPGSAVLFSGFLVGNLGFAVFREHSWATWDRLRASQLNTAELMAAKAVTPVLVLAVQLGVMLGVGALLFDLNLSGSVFAFGVVAAALALMEVSLGFALLAVCRSVLQLNAITNLGAMLLSGLGGAVTPVFLLPIWAQRVAPLTPAYWAMKGFSEITLYGGGMADIVKPTAILVGFSVLFVAIAAFRFRAEDAKVGWV